MLIANRKPAPNPWRILERAVQANDVSAEDLRADDEAKLAASDTMEFHGDANHELIVPLALWRTLPGRAYARGAPRQAKDNPKQAAVLLEPGDDPRELTADFDRIALIAVRFPAFTDGRGYSIARLLRQQLNWNGPLMAVGDVLRDQLLLLERCGFDTFWLRDDQDLDEALSAFGDFGEAYQASAAAVPLFRRRNSLAAGPA